MEASQRFCKSQPTVSALTRGIYCHFVAEASSILTNIPPRYWDVEIKPDVYSYVKAAVDRGYSILTYDRLGTGNSTKADAYTMVQASAEIEIVRTLTELVRAGKLVSSAKVIGSHSNDTSILNSYVPDKVVHVGHSYGSFMTSGLLARYGNMSDGAILSQYPIFPREHLVPRHIPAFYTCLSS